MKVVFMGTPEYSVPTLEALINSEHEVVAVYTKPDMPKGRGKVMESSPIKILAQKHQIPVFQPQNFKSEEAKQEFCNLGAEIAIVIAYGLILPKALLEAFPRGCMNLHASILPKFRGASPIQSSILAGEKKTGVTAMQMDEGLDTGDILKISSIDLDGTETAGQLHDKLAALSAELCLKTLEEFNEITPIKQLNELATYSGKISKEMGEINWALPATEIERKIRAMSPWPSAYTYFKGKMLKIWRADAKPEKSLKAENGQIIELSGNGMEIACGKGSLVIWELQLEGKKRMPVLDFLNGNGMKVGEFLNR